MIGARPLGLRRRPLWVVAVLSVLSLGLYVPLWFGLSWLELRQETRDERAQPALHALSLLVPLYGYWQAYRHFSVIAGLQKGVSIARPVDALSAALLPIPLRGAFGLRYGLPQRLFYRALIVALRALRGVRIGWNPVARLGTSSIGRESIGSDR